MNDRFFRGHALGSWLKAFGLVEVFTRLRA
jgi:hypothetical protein